MEKNAKIFVAGHRGLVGSAIVHALQVQKFTNLVLKTHRELELTDEQAVANFFTQEKPEYVFLAAAKVGGIMANKTYPADFIQQNLAVQNNIIHNAYLYKTKKLLFLGSSCIYPKLCPQPIKEEYLLTGPLESTNKAYAIAKIAGIIECQSYNEQYDTNFISLMPTNLYGPRDNFDLENSHVVPAMIRKFYDAKMQGAPQVTLWGTGNARREFLYIDDFANAALFLMENYEDSSIINVGTGEDVTIKELAEKIRDILGYKGEIVWDTTKPDGTPRKLLDVTKLHALGWKHQIPLDKGITSTYEWLVENARSRRG